MVRVVVTGASGFLGGFVVEACAQANISVVPVARRPCPGCVQVRNYTDIPEGDVLIHLAEERDRSSAEASGAAYERAAESTLATLLARDWERVIYASSSVLYGDTHTAPRKPGASVVINDTYTRVKIHGEKSILATGSGIVVRLANLYGPGMASSNVVSTILQQLDQEGPIKVRDTGPVRDFLWIEDAAKAIASIAATEMEGSNIRGIYNVGTGTGISIGELAQLTCKLAGFPDRQVLATHPSERNSCVVLDIETTRATWGWAPTTDLSDGIKTLLGYRKLETEQNHG